MLVGPPAGKAWDIFMSSRDASVPFADSAHWHALAGHGALCVLTDLDGTLVELAPTVEEAVLDDTGLAPLRELAALGVHVAVVSGRPRSALAHLAARAPELTWYAEHGAWVCEDGAWRGPTTEALELEDLVASLATLAALHAGARLERKSLSVCFHWRQVSSPMRTVLIGAAELTCDEWLESHAAFERLPGAEHVEVRQRTATKGAAVRSIRARHPEARLLALGDDVTDEDMFVELGPGDAAIAVGPRPPTVRVQGAVAGPTEVHGLLRWLLAARRGDTRNAPPLAVVQDVQTVTNRALVVVSNRTPPSETGRARPVGGLVSALAPALARGDGVWLGWSGQIRDGQHALSTDLGARPPRASFDLSPAWADQFYGGFCNRVLWPLFHGMTATVAYRDDEWASYVEANEAYARHARSLAAPDGTIWVHDYHLLLVARFLRAQGHRGRIGLFLHVPFPGRDLLETMPWHRELLAALLEFDLIGVHTMRWAEHVRDALRTLPETIVDGDTLRRGGRATRLGVFPIAIDADAFVVRGEEAPDIAGLRTVLGKRRLLLGVDRLDYSKGIPERLRGFERLLERFPAWRGRISFVQVSVPSRAEIPEYAELKRRVETIVGRINGAYGEADWVPVRYLYRSYEHDVLAQLYRLADVALVTPLRDGMNLVAKEFIAAQLDHAPGVLVLSRFAGAADELTDAVLTNPYHADGMAVDLDRALRMEPAERIRRHARLAATVRATSCASWAQSYLDALAAVPRPTDDRR